MLFGLAAAVGIAAVTEGAAAAPSVKEDKEYEGMEAESEKLLGNDDGVGDGPTSGDNVGTFMGLLTRRGD